MIDLEQYRSSGPEKERTADLLRLLPRGRASVLDVGARDGHFSRLLAERFPAVTALDLQKPSFKHPGVTAAAGDVTRLQFPDGSFDCVFCAEVLEHVPDVTRACREIARVARHEIVIGVPFRQDIRLGRTTCRACGRPNPPWGHLHAFDERRLLRLFPGLRVTARSFVGRRTEATNFVSAALMDLAGNPWGTYDQEEPCVHCGARLLPPPPGRPLAAKVCSALAARLNRLQARWTPPRGNWIHLVFSKDRG